MKSGKQRCELWEGDKVERMERAKGPAHQRTAGRTDRRGSKVGRHTRRGFRAAETHLDDTKAGADGHSASEFSSSHATELWPSSIRLRPYQPSLQDQSRQRRALMKEIH